MKASKVIEALQQALAANNGIDVDIRAYDPVDMDLEDAPSIGGVKVIADINEQAPVDSYGIYLVYHG